MGLHFYFYLCILQHFNGIIQDAKDSFQFTPHPPTQTYAASLNTEKNVILFQLHYLGFPPLPLAHAQTHLHETHNTFVPPQTTHGGTLCSWVGWNIFLGEEGADWELKQLCCFAVLICFETCLTCGDWLMRKAGCSLVNACGFFGKTVHSCRDRVQSVFLCEAAQVRCHRDLVWEWDNLKCSFDARWLELIWFYVKWTGRELCEKGRREQREIFFLGLYMSC